MDTIKIFQFPDYPTQVFFLLEMQTGADPTIVFGKTYDSSVGIESEVPEGLVEAFDRCLVEILSDLEKDLAEKLQ